jgi:hypothetical protein
MAKLVQEFEFVLTEPVSIHKGGELVPVTKLLLKAPSNSHRYYLIKLKQGFISSILSMQKTFSGNKSSAPAKESSEKAEDAFNAKMIVMALLASDVDFMEYMEIFKNLICSDLCLVDGSVKLTGYLFDQISIEDSEELLGKYIESFLLSSWMKLLSQE